MVSANCTHQKKSTSLKSNEVITPAYRPHDRLEVQVKLPPELKKVRGIQDKITRYFSAANRMLIPRYGFQLSPRFGGATACDLYMDIQTEKMPFDAKRYFYGSGRMGLTLSVFDLNRRKVDDIGSEIGAKALASLGLMKSCHAKDADPQQSALKRNLVETHLSRSGQGTRRRTDLPNISAEILHLLENTTLRIGCLESITGQERLQLWRELAAKVEDGDKTLPSFLLKAREHLSKNQPNLAYELCKRTAEVRPQTGAAKCAAMAAQAQKRYPEAIRMWRAHLSFEPDDLEGIISLARSVGQGGDDDGARAIIALALDANPEWLDGHIEIGIALYRLGLRKQARSHWLRGLSLDSENVDLHRLLRDY